MPSRSRRASKGRHRRDRQRQAWISKSIWAVADQALFALTNFTVSLLLARWLSQRDFGGFAVAFSVLLLLGTVHAAVLTEPMLVFGPSRYRGRTTAYVRRLTPLHFALTTGTSAVILLGLLVLAVARSPVGSAMALVALAASAPAILFLWLMRRACYINSLPRLAAAAGLSYALLVPVGMLVLARAGRLTAASALLVLGAASLLVGLWLRVRLTRSEPRSEAEVSSADVIATHWTYGRWALGSGFLGWVPGNVVVLVLPLWHSLDDAATLRVATTLVMPVQQMQAALATLLVPTLVRARLAGRLRSTAASAHLLFVPISLAYAPLVVVFGAPLARQLFGSQYQLSEATLWLLAAIPVCTAVSLVSSSVLRAGERPDTVLLTNIGSTVVTVVLGLPLIFWWGVEGALGSILLSAVTAAALATGASIRITAKEDAGSVPPGRPKWSSARPAPL